MAYFNVKLPSIAFMSCADYWISLGLKYLFN